jgi:putative transposase
MDSTLVMSVLNDALSNYGVPEIFNTDQGSQYTSHIHTKTLSDLSVIISMDGKGRATDNICIERFWRSAKCERIYLNQYNGIVDLRNDIKDYINFYNNRRFHESLGYMKPMQVYYDNLHLKESA